MPNFGRQSTNKYMKRSILVISMVCILYITNAQVLPTENFNVILDTTKFIKGSFIPSARYRNVKREFFEIENTADISLRLRKNGLTVANKLEYARFGDENIMSGGFVFVEYRRVMDTNKLLLEPYFLMLWQEIRSLDMKYAGGMNIRYRLFMNSEAGFFAGVGAFYEFERWNYQGVPDDIVAPIDFVAPEISSVRGSVYLSFKRRFGELFNLDLSTYYQPMFRNFDNYRFASSSEVTYYFNEYIGLALLYQNIYDPAPVVPIDKLFHDLSLGLTLSF